MTTHLDFEGGPLDGAILSLPDEVWIGEILICVPSKMPGDGECWTGEKIYRYVCYSSTEFEGQPHVSHYLGFAGSPVRSVEALEKFLG